MSEPTPSLGRIVVYREGDFEHRTYGGPHADGPHHPGTNGTRDHPAIITRVWTEYCVDLHVFFDGHISEPRISVSRLDTPDHNPNAGWRWPPRV